MSLVVCKKASRMSSEPSIGCIWRRGTRFASECRIRLLISFALVNQRLSLFAIIDYGHHCPKLAGVLGSIGLVPGISQRRTRTVPGKSCPRRPNGHLRNSSHDHHHDVSYSVRNAWRGLYTHHLARKSSSDNEGGEDYSHYLCFLGRLYLHRSAVLFG